MNSKQDIQDFFAQKTIAIAGVSRDHKAFGTAVYRDLKAKGYNALPVNPNAQSIEGDTCYASVAALPKGVGAVLVCTQPAISENVVREAAARGIMHVWLQQGAQSDAAVALAVEKGMHLVSNKCFMMFAEPVKSIHGVHRWFAKLFGQVP